MLKLEDLKNVRLQGKPMADLMHPAHPLMHSATDLVLSAHRPKLKQGAVLVDPNDESTEPKILFMIDHSIREGSGDSAKTISRRPQFVQIDQHGNAENAGWAPHLDLQPIDDYDQKLVADILNAPWITQNLESMALQHASQKLAPEHYNEVKNRHSQQTDKVLATVKERLTKEINYWADRYIKLKNDVKAGKQPRLQPENARRRHDDISARLQSRTQELEAKRQVVSSTPVIVSGALVIPQGLLAMRKGEPSFAPDAAVRSCVERTAMQAVTKAEEALGHTVKDVTADKCGWDITARPPADIDGSIQADRHIEVKGRAKGQSTITVSRNEIIYALNQADKFILAIVVVDGDQYEDPYYVRNPFTVETDFAVASINYDLKDLLFRSISPEQSV